MAYEGSQARGSHWSCSHWSTPQPQQRGIWAESATYTIAHGNVRPGIEPVSSWILVRFIFHRSTTGTPFFFKIPLISDMVRCLLSTIQSSNPTPGLLHYYNNQDMEATPMSINRRMDKEDAVYICNGILLSHKNEWNNAICSNMGRPRDYHTKWSKSDSGSHSFPFISRDFFL